MPNQYTQAEKEGKPKPKGTNQFVKGTREKHDPETRDKIRAEFAAQKLEQYIQGKTELDQAKVAACKALLPYGKSTFAAIEQTTHEDQPSEGELGQKLALLLQNADLVRSLPESAKAALLAALTGKPVAVEQQSTQERSAA